MLSMYTDNNYTTTEKQKLAGIEAGAEVNKIIDVIFNDVSVLDDGTRVATINITPEDIKRWYESNPDTNAFTDSEKAKLAGVSDGAEVNRVDDVLVDGRSVLADDKKARITPEDIKKAYEKNPDTNAFRDDDKAALEALMAWKSYADVDITTNKQDIYEAKSTISDLCDDVVSIDGRVTTLETDTTQLRTDVDAIETRVTETDSDVKGLAKRVTKNETDIHLAQGTADTALDAVNELTTTVNTHGRTIEGLEADKLPYEGATADLLMGAHNVHTDGNFVTGPSDGPHATFNSSSIKFTDESNRTGSFIFSNDEFKFNKRLQILSPVEYDDAADKKYVDTASAMVMNYADSKIQPSFLKKVDNDKITKEADIVLVVVQQATDLVTNALHSFRIDQNNTWDGGKSETLKFKQNEHFIMLPQSQSTNGTRTFYSSERKPGIKVYYDGTWGVFANGIHGIYNTSLEAYANEYRGFQADPTFFTIFGYKFV